MFIEYFLAGSFLRIGKLDPEFLEKYVLSRTGFRDPRVIIGGRIGEDAAVIDLGSNKVLVVHTDPITGSVDLIGYLSITIPSNDIFVRGVKPSWASIALLFPPNASDSEIDRVTKQMHETAEKLEISIIGGHTEFTDAVKRPVAVATMIGLGDRERIVTTSGARAGDLVAVTKSIGLEATAIIARELRDLLRSKSIPPEIIERASRYYEKISIGREALLLSSRGYVSAMHDPTEGGLLAGLAEVAYASNKSLEINLDDIPISEETRVLASALNLDPLRILSSGSLIAIIKREYINEAIDLLKREGVEIRVIGEVVDKRDYLVKLRSSIHGEFVIKDLFVRDPLIELFNKIFSEAEK